jgi:hypothetical protein
MAMALVVDEVRRVQILRVAAVANHEIAAAAVHDHGVEAQQTPVAAVPDDTLDDRAVVWREIPIHDLHLSDESLRVDSQIRFAGVVVQRIITGHAGALRTGIRGGNEQRHAKHDWQDTSEPKRCEHLFSWKVRRA